MKLSVVIPCFNLGPWLEPCLESLARQTVSADEWEIVLIDDGSTDDTGSRAEAWRERLKNLAVYHIPNGGVNAARRYGFGKAKGEAIWFVDGDDVLAPNAIELALRAFARDVDLARVDEAYGDKIVFKEETPRIEILERGQFSRIGRIVMHQCVFRRGLVESTPFENYLVGEDILFAAKALVNANRVALIGAPLYGYVTRGNSVMNVARNYRRTSQAIAFSRELLRFYSNEGRGLNPREIHRRHSQFYYFLPLEILKFPRSERRRLKREWVDAAGRLAGIRFYCGAIIAALYSQFIGRK